MTSNSCDYQFFDMIQEVKNYIDSICRCDDKLVEEVAKCTFFSILRQKRSHKEFCHTLENLYLDEKETENDSYLLDELKF